MRTAPRTSLRLCDYDSSLRCSHGFTCADDGGPKAVEGCFPCGVDVAPVHLPAVTLTSVSFPPVYLSPVTLSSITLTPIERPAIHLGGTCGGRNAILEIKAAIINLFMSVPAFGSYVIPLLYRNGTAVAKRREYRSFVTRGEPEEVLGEV